MPVKHRRAKGRAFDDYRKEQLIAGPDACLLAGVGYLTARNWNAMPAEEQAAALEDMKADWAAHGATLMEWWNAGPGSASIGTKPWVFPYAGGAGTLPWAAEQFGDPPCR